MTDSINICLVSTYGNANKIARPIGKAVGGQVSLVGDVNPANLIKFGLLFIGSPTHGGWLTEGIRDLQKVSPALEGVSLAVFDTRTKKLLFGFAAPSISRSLEKNGGKLAHRLKALLCSQFKGHY
jgi:flavodoxin